MGREERRRKERNDRRDKKAANELSAMLHEKYQRRTQEIIEEITKNNEAELRKYEDLYCEVAEENWSWFYALAALTLKRDYHRNTDQIGKFIERCEDLRKNYNANGYSQKDVLKICEDETDIKLVSEVNAKE